MENKNLNIILGYNQKQINRPNMKKGIIVQKFKNQSNDSNRFLNNNIYDNKNTVNMENNLQNGKVISIDNKSKYKNIRITINNNNSNDENKNILNITFQNRNLGIDPNLLIQNKINDI